MTAVLLGLVLEVEANGQLEVELHSAALVRTLEGVVDLNVDLGPVEGSVSWVLLPRLAELVERFREGSLRLIPHGVVAELVCGACR